MNITLVFFNTHRFSPVSLVYSAYVILLIIFYFKVCMSCVCGEYDVDGIGLLLMEVAVII